MKQRYTHLYHKGLSIFPFIISAFAVIVYYPSLFGKFVIDDGSYFKNSILTQLKISDIKAVFMAPTNRWGELLPLRDYLYVLEYNVFGKWTTGYHLISLLLFIASGFVIYYWAKLLFEDKKFKDQAPLSKYWPAKASACIVLSLFLLNPMYVETVAYISGQKDILSVLMISMSLVFLYKAGKKSTENIYLVFVLGILFYYLAVLSKLLALATVIFIPVLWLITSDKKPTDIFKMVGLWVAANIPVLLWMQHVLSFPNLTKVYISTGLFERIVRAVNIIGVHLSRITWPDELSFGYDFIWPKEYNFHWYTNFDLNSVIGLLFLLVLIVLFFKYRNSLITLGMLLFIIYLSPALSIFPDLANEKIYDRYLALPLIGLFLMVLGLMHLLHRFWPKTKMVLALFIVFICASWTVMTVNYIPVYKNDLAVREHRYKLDPRNDYNIHTYIKVLIAYKKYAEAEFLIKNIDPRVNLSDSRIEFYLGYNYYAQQKFDLAEPLLYSSSIKASKGHEYPYANYYLAMIYLNKGNEKMAEALLREQLVHPYKPIYEVIAIENLLKEIKQRYN